MTRQSLHLPPLSRCIPIVVAALALGASASSRAGEALDIELPSMRTPIEALQAPASSVMAASATSFETAPAPLTRADVREALKMARASNTMTPAGEIGDTTEVLQAREDFYVLQTEVLQAEYLAAAQRAQAQQQSLLEQQAAANVDELLDFVDREGAQGTTALTRAADDELVN